MAPLAFASTPNVSPVHRLHVQPCSYASALRPASLPVPGRSRHQPLPCVPLCLLQLLYLQLASAGVQSREADHAASHLGKAVGIATLLKGTKYHGERRRSYLPVDLCAKHGVSQVRCGDA